MPTLDGAHGFLTVLLPLHTAPCRRADGTITSPAHAVRELLATLPTAQHSPACVDCGLQSPFARSPSTHFARLAVIDQPAFNGRDTVDAILSAIAKTDLLEAKRTDFLARPYLLFCADFDIPAQGADPVRGYLADLWLRMPQEWAAILEHCEGYAANGAAGFVDYLAACQIDTTMPFNDYPVAPGPAGAPPMLAPSAIALVAGLAAGWLVHLMAGALAPWLDWTLTVLGFAAVGVFALILAMLWWGQRRSPWTAGVDLPTVLKSLYLQARFTRFAIDHQESSAADLQAAFNAFLAEVRPDDLTGPTQPPGVTPNGVRPA